MHKHTRTVVCCSKSEYSQTLKWDQQPVISSLFGDDLLGLRPEWLCWDTGYIRANVAPLRTESDLRGNQGWIPPFIPLNYSLLQKLSTQRWFVSLKCYRFWWIWARQEDVSLPCSQTNKLPFQHTLISLWRGCAADIEVVLCGCWP